MALLPHLAPSFLTPVPLLPPLHCYVSGFYPLLYLAAIAYFAAIAPTRASHTHFAQRVGSTLRTLIPRVPPPYTCEQEETGLSTGFKPCGFIELATNEVINSMIKGRGDGSYLVDSNDMPQLTFPPHIPRHAPTAHFAPSLPLLFSPHPKHTSPASKAHFPCIHSTPSPHPQHTVSASKAHFPHIHSTPSPHPKHTFPTSKAHFPCIHSTLSPHPKHTFPASKAHFPRIHSKPSPHPKHTFLASSIPHLLFAPDDRVIWRISAVFRLPTD